MAVSPREQLRGLRPVEQAVAASLETQLDDILLKRTDREGQVDHDLGFCGEPIAKTLEDRYRKVGWVSYAYQVERRWTLALARGKLSLPEGIQIDEQ